MQNKIALILSDNNLTVLFSSLLGAVVGGAITIIANIITNINSQKLEKAKNENESRAIEFLFADAIKQSLIILEGSFGIVVNNKTKYGYLENSDTSLKYIMKMLEMHATLSRRPVWEDRSKSEARNGKCAWKPNPRPEPRKMTNAGMAEFRRYRQFR